LQHIIGDPAKEMAAGSVQSAWQDPHEKEIAMKLVTVEAKLAPDCVARSVAVFNGEAAKVRKMDGCEHYAIYEAPGGIDAILIVQKWRSLEQFDAYRQSVVFAVLGQGLKPMMAAPPVTTIAEVE
jgi:quinol monooxygenase YgiN